MNIPKQYLIIAVSCLLINTAVFSQLTADFSFAQNGCVPDTAKFTNKSTGAVSYKWTFGDMSMPSTSSDPTHIYMSPGTHIITLTAYGAGGDSAKASKSIVVINKPNAFFWIQNSKTCFGTETKFENNSWPNTCYAKWYFDDGDSSSKYSPEHTYLTKDTFDVMLISSNMCGSDTFINSHIVSDNVKPLANMWFWPDPACPTETINFNNNSSNTTSYLWTFGDGDSSTSKIPTHQYTAPGNYTINLYAFNGCGTDTMTDNIVINGSLTDNVFFNVSSYDVCPDEEIQFSCSNDNFVSFHWDFDDGTSSSQMNPAHSYSSPGTYNVILSASNHCGKIDVDSSEVTVDPDSKPSVSFNYNPLGNICPGTAVQFENTSSDTSYGVLWDFDDGNTSTSVNPQHIFNDTGTYNVSLVTYNVCGNSDTAYSTVFVNNQGMIMANFNPWPWPWTPICKGTEIYFENFSMGATDYLWDFDDGNTSTEISPTHAFNSTGFYNVVLTATNKCGQADNQILSFNIRNDADPYIYFSFWPTSECMGVPVSFYNGSSDPENSLWYFGDGDTSTAINPIHTYNSHGVFDIMLIISNNCGSDTLIQQITIKETPQADFSASTVCNGTPASFTDNSTGTIDNYAWDFGDGDTSSAQNPNHIYSIADEFDVTLSVSKGECSSNITKAVTINGANAEAGSNVEICAGGNTDLTASGGINYNWSNGATTQTINVNPAGDTWYYVTVTDGDGCTGIDSVEVTIGSFNISAGADVTICSGDNTTLSATGGNTYSWSPSTGLSNTAISNPTASPSATTTYVVEGSDGSGCTDTDTVTVFVNSITADAGLDDSICDGGSTTLNASGGNFYSWSPTSLSNPNASNPIASPAATTTYTVTVSDTAGCKDMDQVTIYVHKNFADAGSDIFICKGDTTMLSATGGTSYHWNTGDNTSSIKISPGITQFYFVTVTDANGCTEFDDVKVNVKSTPNANTTPDTNICPGDDIDMSSSGGVNYSWNTGDNTDVINVSPSAKTTYYVTVTGSNACKSYDSVTVDIDSIGVTTLSDTTEGNCATINLTTNIDVGTANSFTWSPSIGLDDTGIQNPTLDFSAINNGITTYTVTVTNTLGCKSIDDVAVNNDSLHIAVMPDTGICNNRNVNLQTTISGGSPVAYSWSPATGLSATDVLNPVLDANSLTPGVFNYSITVTDIYGCTATDDINVTVNGLPTANAGSDTAICEGGTARLIATGGLSYSWNTGDLKDTIFTSPVSPSNYTVTVIDGNGCKDSDQVLVTLNTLPTANAGPDKQVCKGSTITLTASGGVSYKWSTGDNTASTNVSPIADSTFYVTVTNNNGCKDIDDVDVTVNPLPTADAGSDQTICEDEQAILNATGGNTFSWSNGKNTASVNVQPTDSIIYYVTITDLNNCSAMDSVAVHVNEKPLATILDTSMATCGSADGMAMASASGGTGSYSYQWDAATGSQTNDTASGLNAGVYYVTVNDGLCSDDTLATINEIGAPALTISSDTAVCAGDTVMLNVSGADSYNWSPASGLNTTVGDTVYASPATTTNYTIQGITGGCSTFGNIKVTINAYPTVDIGTNTNVCANLHKILDAGSGYDSYLWSTGGTNDTVWVDSSGVGIASHDYAVTVTNNSCATIDSVELTYLATPDANAGANQTMCDNDSVTLTASGGINYFWSNGASSSNTNVSPADSTTFYVTVEDANGCLDNDSVNVFTLQSPNALITNIVDETCGNTDGSATVTPSGGTGSYTYIWDSNTGSQTDSTATGLEAGIYYVTVEDGQCKNIKMVTINELGVPTVVVMADTSVCYSDSIMLSASGASSYLWIPSSGLGDTTGSQVKASPASTITYTVIGDNGGCSDTGNINVTVKPNPAVDLGNDTTLCADQSILLQAGSGYDSYLWSSGNTTDTYTADSNGTGTNTAFYHVTVTNNQCTTVDTIVVTYTICGGIITADNDVMVKLYPNPANDKVNIITTGLKHQYDLNIINPQGKLIWKKKVKITNAKSNQIILNTSNYAKGIYFINIIYQNKKIVTKLIIQ